MKRFERPRTTMRLLVVGKTGTGKSTRVKEALRAWQALGVRIVAVDVCDEYSKHGRPRHGLTSEGTLQNRVTAIELARNTDLIKDARLSLAVVPGNGSEAALDDPRAMARTALFVMNLVAGARRPTVIVFDEIGRWTNSSAGPECHAAGVRLASFASADRKNGLAGVFVSQCASQIPSDVRRQCDEMWIFLQDYQADLDALSERIGKERAAAVSRLPQFEFEVWRDATHNTRPQLRAIPGEKS